MVSRGRWHEPGHHPSRHFGTETEDLDEDVEGNEDGCPGGWYRCAFIDSAARYFRRASSDGVLSENIDLTRTDDRLVVDAVHYYEIERSRWRAWAGEIAARRSK